MNAELKKRRQQDEEARRKREEEERERREMDPNCYPEVKGLIDAVRSEMEGYRPDIVEIIDNPKLHWGWGKRPKGISEGASPPRSPRRGDPTSAAQPRNGE